MAIEVGPCSSLIYIDLPIKKWCFFSIVMLVDAQRHGTEGMERHGSCLAWHQTTHIGTGADGDEGQIFGSFSCLGEVNEWNDVFMFFS